ncbi:penicillin acylase family protein [Belliella kenyensis]|uniref:Penicillin acylase family protein n=1 Tax=Belliella kenyensis TaxID=1472724 RepID=A0ABV8EH52_9BACT|nr:penicillin acylase family protein [Belliella kenyensis]MCH7401701.1 penicillin acylase family protein [Belliella kenyensis]MDN3604201.1 penicillin acylase family protein [Belliella kenyensis]
MKYISFAFFFVLTIIIGLVLSMQIDSIPPLGKLLDPHHGFWQNAYSEDQNAPEDLVISGLKNEVEVIYDEFLIPHIYAANEEDLYRVQGYVTAQHRLWQMDFQTLAAAGRIAEIVGPVAIDLDRTTRRKGLPFAAEQGISYLQKEDPEIYLFLEAYAEGVNAYISQLTEASLPLEYKILNYKPEPWSPYKSLLLLKYMADMLVGDRDLEYTNLRAMLGKDLFERLYPLFPEENDPVIESDRVWDFEPLPIDEPEELHYPSDSILLKALPQPTPGTGSNNWAVSGKKTASGNPILANDPHLSMNLPSLWYAMQLSTPDFSVKGATLPGALGVISGFNENIAWGVTNATRDTRDWYAITFKNPDRSEYLYNDQWVNSNIRIEEIKIKGQASLLDTVIYTHHGPVVYDRSFGAERKDTNYALKWTAHLPSIEQRTFLMLNKGKNHADYLQALDHYTSPAQNFVFASREGDIAMKVQGRFPLKWHGQGMFFMDGNDPQMEWLGYVPNEHNASSLNPQRGFVSSANQHPVTDAYPYFVFDHSFEHYRNRRLNQRLEEMEQITIQDMMRLQFDNYHLLAAEAAPVMMKLLSADESFQRKNEDKYWDQLAQWDFYTNPSQSAPTIFHLWWRYLYKSIWKNLDESGVPIVYPNYYQTVALITQDANDTIFDIRGTAKRESVNDHLKVSYDSMVVQVEKLIKTKGDYSWGTFKNTSVKHLVPNFEAFSYHNIQTGGGAGILNATSERHGASWRMVVEMADQPIAHGIYPGGQSGNPGSKFYDTFLNTWANGAYVDFGLNQPDIFRNPLFTTRFKP